MTSCQSRQPASFNTLPFEILILILRLANINGDLMHIHLTSSQLHAIAHQEHHALSQDLHQHYGIESRLLDMHQAYRGPRDSEKASRSPLRDLLFLQHDIARIKILTADIERHNRIQHEISTKVQNESIVPQFLLFAALTEVLHTASFDTDQAADVLAPSPTITRVVAAQLSAPFRRFIEELSLAEIESVISAINICATKLWSSVILHVEPHCRVTSFASLSGQYFNIDQAILTEHVIWKGPSWVARVLQTEGKGRATSQSHQFDKLILTKGAWCGSREDGARLAANGLARWLWKERQKKIDSGEERAAEEARSQMIADLRVNTAVWRGSAGDL